MVRCGPKKFARLSKSIQAQICGERRGILTEFWLDLLCCGCWIEGLSLGGLIEPCEYRWHSRASEHLFRPANEVILQSGLIHIVQRVPVDGEIHRSLDTGAAVWLYLVEIYTLGLTVLDWGVGVLFQNNIHNFICIVERLFWRIVAKVQWWVLAWLSWKPSVLKSWETLILGQLATGTKAPAHGL